MKRSKKGSQVVGSGKSGSQPSQSKRASAATDSSKHQGGVRHRVIKFVAGGAVLLMPLLLAGYLNWTPSPDTSEARVTRILNSLNSEKESRRSNGRNAVSDSPAAAVGGKSVPVVFERGSRAPLGQIQIPSIDLKTRYYEGVHDNAVELGPGHWPGTPWPGGNGNTVFAGHRTTYTHPFEDLDLLRTGDRIKAGLRNAVPTTYRVLRTRVVPEAEYAEFVLKQPKNEKTRIITLFACTPKGSRTHRIVVRARAPEARPKASRGGSGL